MTHLTHRQNRPQSGLVLVLHERTASDGLFDELIDEARALQVDILSHIPADLFHEPVTWEVAEWQ